MAGVDGCWWKVRVGSVKPGQGEATAGLGKEGDTGPVKVSRLVAGGVAGPVLFTLAWVISSRRQAGHCAGEVQLSGLAAEDARDPQIMMAGFVLLGVGTVMFGAGLGRVTATRAAGPWLVVAAVTGVTPTREHQPTRAAETVSSLYAGRTTAVRNAGPRPRPSAHVPN
jgi:hypothetical protein